MDYKSMKSFFKDIINSSVLKKPTRMLAVFKIFFSSINFIVWEVKCIKLKQIFFELKKTKDYKLYYL